MQPTVVMAFRNRLVTRGYTKVSIKHLFDDYYQVTFVDPVFYRICSGVLTSVEMYHIYRR